MKQKKHLLDWALEREMQSEVELIRRAFADPRRVRERSAKCTEKVQRKREREREIETVQRAIQT